MANYYASWRSSYFKVNNLAEFKEAMHRIPCVEVVEGTGDNVGKVALLQDNSGDGCGITQFYDDPDTKEERDFYQDVAVHLQDDQVAVFMEAGAERLRYIVGYAVAVRADGRVLTTSIHDIFKKIDKHWKNKEYTDCEY